MAQGPSSGPLKVELTESSLRSYSFLSSVGGVAFGAVASPGPVLADGAVRLTYDASKPDGQRLAVVVHGKSFPQDLPDWVLIPVAFYADSDFHACASLFGPETNSEQYDIMYHPALEDTVLGLRILQADILFFDLESTWRLPARDGKTVLGLGEALPETMDWNSAESIQDAFAGSDFDSWVLTDQNERITVDLVDGKLRFLGQPYYYFWTANHWPGGGEPVVLEVTEVTRRVGDRWDAIGRFNPAVHAAVTRTVHYAAFFRWVKNQHVEAWKSFLAQLEPVTVLPKVETPTLWAR